MLFNELSEDRKLEEIEKCRNDESYLDYDWWKYLSKEEQGYFNALVCELLENFENELQGK